MRHFILILPILWTFTFPGLIMAADFRYFGVHLTAQEPWVNTITVYNNGDPEAVCTIIIRDAAGVNSFQEDYTVPANDSRVLVMSNFTGYIPSAAEVQLAPVEGTFTLDTESPKLRPKVSYRYGDSQSLCEFFLADTLAGEYVLPNTIQDHFSWSGIAVMNPWLNPISVKMSAYLNGEERGALVVRIDPLTKYVRLSDLLWPGTGYSGLDMVRVRGLGSTLPPPMSITGDDTQGRHVFFNGAVTDLLDPRLAYLGQTPPGLSPVRFIPHIITEEVHTTTVFSPDGTEVYWTPMEAGYFGSRFMKLINGVWTAPETAMAGGSPDIGDPFFSTDGNRLYFTSYRAPNVPGILHKENIWYADRSGQGWGDAVVLNSMINGMDLHWSFSLADNGNLYFAGHPLGGVDENDIYLADFENGNYVRRIRLGDNINTQYFEDTPFIAPDESYLMFTRFIPATGRGDIYICFRENSGSWSDPVNMAAINSIQIELCPHVTRDGRFLFFMSTRTGVSRPYWIGAEVIDLYR